MEGCLGIAYVCGEHSGGKFTVIDSLLGRKVRQICGASDRIVALVDAWELKWLSLGENAEEAAVSVENERGRDTLHELKLCQVAAGETHNVALSLDGELFSWGPRGGWNELGFKHGKVKTLDFKVDDTATLIPHRIITASKLFFSHLSCGKNHSAAVTDNGDLYTWGRNRDGQLGHVFQSLSKETNAMSHCICAWPKYVGLFLKKPRVVSACCGNTFTVVLLADGSVYLLGGGALRPGSIDMCPNTKTRFLMLKNGSNGDPFVDIASGSDHFIAVTKSGEMYSWGLNTFGQLGQGSTSGRGKSEGRGSRVYPDVVASDKSIKWAKVFAGGSYSAAITTTHQLYTWGNGRFGKLGHGVNSERSREYDCEFVPRCVEKLQHTVVNSVLCGDRNLFVFAPTSISAISPICGDSGGGYELRLRGSGFWASDNVTVRFVPLTDGRLLRGTLGIFCVATGEIVCNVPKFRLTGEYIVEVAMDGKTFTTNGLVFTVFKRPQVVAVSAYDAQASGGEEVALSLCGNLPLMCQRPIVRFTRYCVDQDSRHANAMNTSETVVLVVGEFDKWSESGREESGDVTRRLLRLILPAFVVDGDGVVPFTLEISYDNGIIYTPVCVDPAFTGQKGEKKDIGPPSQSEHCRPANPYILWVHNAQFVRVIPNSFLIDKLPHTFTLELTSLLPPEIAQLLVTIEHQSPAKEDLNSSAVALLKASAPLSIDKVRGNIVTCTVPPLTDWHITPSAVSEAQSRSTDWWEPYTETGFVTQMHVSMNGGRTFLSPQQQLGGSCSLNAMQVYGMAPPGRLLSVFPNIGTVSGGTQVSVASDFFHFDTHDATVKLKWRERCVVLPAVCLQPETLAAANQVHATTRRVVFQTPPFPFPDDVLNPGTTSESMPFDTRKEVDLVVSLDGEHYTDTSLVFVYCAVPEISEISPREAEPGTKMVLAVTNLINTSLACVKLEATLSKISMVIPVEINEAAHAVEFLLPELPLGCGELVLVAFSLNGQEFYEVQVDTLNGGVGSFRYKSSANPS